MRTQECNGSKGEKRLALRSEACKRCRRNSGEKKGAVRCAVVRDGARGGRQANNHGFTATCVAGPEN
jgi:hypothetical protein